MTSKDADVTASPATRLPWPLLVVLAIGHLVVAIVMLVNDFSTVLLFEERPLTSMVFYWPLIFGAVAATAVGALSFCALVAGWRSFTTP